MVHDLYTQEIDLVDDLRQGLSDNLEELFARRTKRWPHPCTHDESFTLSTFGDLTENISTARAFILVPRAIDIALKQDDRDLLLTSLSLIIELGMASQTTELPSDFYESAKILEDKIVSMPNNAELLAYWDDIKKWYRV